MLTTFGIPLVSPRVSHQVGRRFVRLLEDQLDLPVQLLVVSSYSELCDELASGRVDLAWLPPLEAAQVSEYSGVQVLLQATRAGHGYYHSVIFVRDDSPIQELAQLEGKRIAYVHRRSAAGFLVAAAHLLSQGVHTASPPQYLGSHGAVVQAVADGEAEAGATYGTVIGDGPKIRGAGWWQLPPDPPCEMRPLAWAGPIPSDVICAWPGTSRRLRTSFMEAFQALMDDPERAAVVRELFGTDRFQAPDGAGYDVLARSLATVFRPRL